MAEGRPRCAACGFELRRGQKAGFVDCYVVHQHCVHMPANLWAVAQAIEQTTAAAAQQVRILKAEFETVRDLLDEERRSNSSYREAVAVVATGDRVKIRRLEAIVVRLERERDRLEADLVELQNIPVENTPIIPYGDEGWRFMASQLGGAIGRGVWGIASYFAHVLDRADPTVARFALLDLS